MDIKHIFKDGFKLLFYYEGIKNVVLNFWKFLSFCPWYHLNKEYLVTSDE